jgi:CubicO group peptidase (beta-lactamase class C family)
LEAPLPAWPEADASNPRMSSKSLWVLVCSAGVVASFPACARQGADPASGIDLQQAWPAASPESQGLRTDRLDAAWADLQPRKTDGFLVIRNDRVVYERYAPGFSRTKTHSTASMAKAVVGATSLMLAMDDGLISPDDQVSKFLPAWADVPLKRDITIRELATHTSGLDDANDDRIPVQHDGSSHTKLKGWMGDFWKYPKGGGNPFTIARDLTPVIFKPGTAKRYSNPGIAILTYCVTASLRGGPQTDTRSLLKYRIMDKIGVAPEEWAIGYGTTTVVDGLPLVALWGGGAFSPNATARIARLMLHEGVWNGQRLISEASVRQATQYSGMPNNAGLCWWVNRRPDGSRIWPAAPADAFWGDGAGEQFVFVVPSLNLIVVRYGNFLDRNPNYEVPVGQYIVNPVLQAVSP